MLRIHAVAQCATCYALLRSLSFHESGPAHSCPQVVVAAYPYIPPVDLIGPMLVVEMGLAVAAPATHA